MKKLNQLRVCSEFGAPSMIQESMRSTRKAITLVTNIAAAEELMSHMMRMTVLIIPDTIIE